MQSENCTPKNPPPAEVVNEPLEKHRAFIGSSFSSLRFVPGYDYSISREKMFLIPNDYLVVATNERGEEIKQYVYDSNICTGPNGMKFSCKEAAEANGYKYSFRLRRYQKEDSPDFYGTDVQLSSHSGVRLDHSKEEDEWLAGFEVEKEDLSMRRFGYAWKMLHETGWCKENDGSLDSHGFEMVSPILPLMDHKRLMASFKSVQKYLDASYSASCGGHINLSHRKLDGRQLMEKLKPSIGLLMGIYESRINNRYCPVKKFENYLRAPEKYSAFNLSKGNGIVEIRLFPAVKNVKQLIWRANLLKILLTTHPSFQEKVESLMNPKSWLYTHLLKVFTAERIGELVKKTIVFHKDFVEPIPKKVRERLVKKGAKSEWFGVPARTSNDTAVTNLQF